MGSAICYLNAELDLKSAQDLRSLAAAFEARGLSPLHVGKESGDLWCARFEAGEQHDQPEPTVGAMLMAIESLSEPLRDVWSACTLREFNLGYECGGKPWAFNQALSSQLLGRMAAAGASLRITLYPPEREKEDGIKSVRDPKARKS